jgi:hypothetical protein
MAENPVPGKPPRGQEMASLMEAFADLRDPRRRTCRYPFERI